VHTQGAESPESLSIISAAPLPQERSQRWAALLHRMSEQAARTLVILDLSWVFYLTGFDGSAGYLLVRLGSEDSAYLCTDGRYHEAASEVLEDQGLEELVQIRTDDPLQPPPAGALEAPLALLARAADPALLRRLLSIDPDLLDARAVLSPLRARKSPWELAVMRSAAAIADRAMDAALASLEPGLTTERELAARFEAELRRLGADGPAFPTIIASADRSALPHARPSDRPIEGGDVLVVDFGALLHGYRSDATRTLVVAADPPPALVATWNLVAAAQAAGIAAARPGAPATAIEAAAREVLRDAGVEELLVHGIGHGVGLEIHEHPLTAHDEEPLAEGTTVTVEPGLYQVGRFGVRLEDTLVVTRDGSERLTRPATATPLVLSASREHGALD